MGRKSLQFDLDLDQVEPLSEWKMDGGGGAGGGVSGVNGRVDRLIEVSHVRLLLSPRECANPPPPCVCGCV